MNSTPGPPVAPGTVELAGGPKLSRSEARRLKEEEEAAQARSLAEAWRIGGKAKVNEQAPQEEDPKKIEERERSRSREKKETLHRLAKTAAEKAAAAKAAMDADADGTSNGEATAPKLSKAEEARLLMAKEKEKARLKKQAMQEAKKEEEMKKKMAVLEKDLNKSDKSKYKRY
ncbi:unnamed protein product [Cladocopium goreaui]|uniref:Serine/threonine-protein kinase Nek10 n=1 Tax=Cladocopium goreaui TaxID=2562237 RepID=A0A9P1FE81_9DINO|nr:unnamed protein product [Cladocopium goreaui]